MNSESDFPPEYQLFGEFREWCDRGRQLILLFRQYNVAVPKTLDLLTKSSNESPHKSLVVLPPTRPDAPTCAKDDWRWIVPEEASLQSVALAVLKDGQPMSPGELAKRLIKIIPDTTAGSVYNMGPRLEGKKIQKTQKGWSIIEGQEVPILYRGYIWAPPRLLSPQDMAAFRRMAVLHLLSSYPDGLKTVDIYKTLAGVDWLGKPLSKDLIQDDLEAMEDKKVRQMGRSKKWKLGGKASGETQ